MAFRIAVVAAASLALLPGCGGSSSSMPEVPFTSFAAVKPNETVVMSGISQTGSGSQTLSGAGVTVTSVNLDAVDAAGSAAKLSFGPTGDLTGVSVSTPQHSIAFSRAAGDAVSCGSGACSAENASGFAVAVDAFFVGWNYQTFGVWLRETSPSAFQFGSISVGSVTPASAVTALTGTSVLFTGFANGFLIDGGGAPFFTASQMSATVNFTTRAIAFGTSSTQVANLNTGFMSLDTGFNLSGNLSYDPGVNRFTGAVTAQNNATTGLAGSATGRFYGPAAQEMGGVYSLSGNGLYRMVGGFGGRQ